jgi:hypothetical protein
VADIKIPRRISTALLNSLAGGVVPRAGLEYIAVGRKNEVAALLGDLENVGEGGASFRFIVGRYGSGKSFLLQLLRNYATEREFVVADVDLSPERRLAGTGGSSLGTYRELLRNLSTKTRPDGGALAPILERWISSVQSSVVQEGALKPNSPKFDAKVEARILEVITSMQGMVHGFDFATVLTTYWRGYRQGEDSMKEAALRWFRGEFANKTEARGFLNIRVIVDDDSWYDYLKLFASFVSSIGYKGLLLLIDEGVNLYKITNTVSRQNNYEKLLTMFNDTMQGKAEHLGILLGGTSQFVEDPRRGLFSYEALRSRLAESRFAKDGMRDMAGPIIRLDTLTHEEIFLLLKRLAQVHALHYGYPPKLSDTDLQAFLQEVVARLGAADLLTPREVVRDFIALMNILQQNPAATLEQFVKSADFKPSVQGKDPDMETSAEFADFKV